MPPRAAQPTGFDMASPGAPPQAADHEEDEHQDAIAAKGKHTRRVNQPNAVAAMCKASGKGLDTAIARQAAIFTIEAFNSSGTRMSSGGDLFRVDVRGSSVVRARVTDNEDGTYTCKYVPSTSGSYTISITLAGVSLAGSPFAVSCLMPRPDCTKCILKGEALSSAVAREPTSFEVSFLDAVGNFTHAEELDVSVEHLSDDDDGMDPLERMRQQAKQTFEDVAVPTAATTDVAEEPPEPEEPARDGEEPPAKQMPDPPKGSESAGVLASKPIRRLVRGPKPLIVREGCELDSAIVGQILVGKLVDVVEARETPDGLRTRILLQEIEEQPFDDLSLMASYPGASPRNISPRVASARTFARPFADPFHVCSSLIESASMPALSTAEQLMKESFRPSKAAKGAAAQADFDVDPYLSTSPQGSAGNPYGWLIGASCGGAGSSGSGSPGRSSIANGDSSALGSSSSPKTGLTYGWVTAIQASGQVLLGKPYMRLEAGERQQHMSLWQRRKMTESIAKAALSSKFHEKDAQKKAEITVGPSFASELESDPQGVAFAFGGCDPGTLHAKGQVIKQHTVRYSIGLAGRYRLHVGLRQQGVALPGSPFLVEVTAGGAHAPSTRIPDNVDLVGPVGQSFVREGGEGEVAGCSFVLHAADKMGNLCKTGGTALEVKGKGEKGEALNIDVIDNQDGSYVVEFCSEVSGTFPVSICIAHVHVQGSPITITMTAGPPDIGQTTLDGDGLKSAKAGLPAEIVVHCKDIFGNNARRSHKISFGLAMLPLKEVGEVKGGKDKGNKESGDRPRQGEPNSAAATIPSMEFDGTWLTEVDGSELYDIKYLAQEAGDFDLHVWCDPDGSGVRKWLNGSPFVVRVSGVTASPKGSLLTGADKYEFFTNDEAMRLLPDTSGSAGVASPSSIAGEKSPNALRRSMRAPSSANLEVVEDTTAPKWAKLGAGERLTLRPHLRDAYGNASFATEGTLVSRLVLPDNAEVPVPIRQFEKLGMYELNFDTNLAGPHSLHVTLNDEEIQFSPFTFIVTPAAPVGSKSRLTQHSAAIVNQPCEMLLVAVDKYGNTLINGGANVAARALGTGVSAPQVEDREDGTYIITFSSSVVQECKVNVRLDNMDMSQVSVYFEEPGAKKGKGTAVATEAPDLGPSVEAAPATDASLAATAEEAPPAPAPAVPTGPPQSSTKAAQG